MATIAILRHNGKELVIKGLRTHSIAEVLCKELRDILLSKDLSLIFFFEGELGPKGKGMVVRVIFNRGLSKYEVVTLEKLFNVMGIKLISELPT